MKADGKPRAGKKAALRSVTPSQNLGGWNAHRPKACGGQHSYTSCLGGAGLVPWWFVELRCGAGSRELARFGVKGQWAVVGCNR